MAQKFVSCRELGTNKRPNVTCMPGFGFFLAFIGITNVYFGYRLASSPEVCKESIKKFMQGKPWKNLGDEARAERLVHRVCGPFLIVCGMVEIGIGVYLQLT